VIQGDTKGIRSSESDQWILESKTVEHLLDRGLIEPARSFLSRHGKGLRAALMRHCFWIAGGGGEVPEKAVMAIELLHAGSLIVDDIEDRSELRRGEPALHRQIGLPLALNTGNWMYFRAIEIVGELAFEFREADHLLLRSVETVRECHEGQAIDLAAQISKLDQADVRATVEAISLRKTAKLTALAARIAATLAGACESDIEILSQFGADLGMCLQMCNDLDEVRGASANGTRCDDLINGRVTWPWAWFAETCERKQFEELQSRALDVRTDLDVASNLAAILYHQIGQRAEQQIARKFRQQFVHLHSVFDDQQAIASLQQALQVIVATC